jgi:hypothetical protein
VFAWIGLPSQMDQIFKSMCKASTFHPHTEISASWGLSMMATSDDRPSARPQVVVLPRRPRDEPHRSARGGIAIARWRVVTSRPVRAEDPWMGIFSGEFRTLDTYFILSRYQHELMSFRKRTGGEVIELHSYLASRELEAASPAVVRALVETELVRAWPELTNRIVHVESAANERTFDKQGVGHAGSSRACAPGFRTSCCAAAGSSSTTPCTTWRK